jgi:hypothetical protein
MEITPEAIVTRVVKLPVRELVEGVQVGGFAVYAKMCVPTHKYSNGLYLVKIEEPIAVKYLEQQRGSLMEHGEFQFDALDYVPVGSKLKVSVLATTPNESAAG